MAEFYKSFAYVGSNGELNKYDLNSLELLNNSSDGAITSLHTYNEQLILTTYTKIQIRSLTTLDLISEFVVTTNGNMFDSEIVGNYIYVFSNQSFQPKTIKKYDLRDFTLAAQSINFNDSPNVFQVRGIISDDTYLYVHGEGDNENHLIKLNLNDLSLVANVVLSPFMIMGLVEDGDYLYSVGRITDFDSRIRRWNKSNLSYTGLQSQSLTFSNYNQETILIKNNYLYVTGNVNINPTIDKINLNDLTHVSITPANSSSAFTTHNNDFYGVDETYISKYNTNLTLVNTGTTNVIGDMCILVAEDPLALDFPPSFCKNPDYTVSGATCGNANGSLLINNLDYTYLYDFTLKDVENNSYTHVDGLYTGLTSNYYFLYATPKPEYWSVYGRETCVQEWIKIESTDTTLSLTALSVEPAMCLGFGRQRGRLGYVFEDTVRTPNYVLKIYTKDGAKVYEESMTGLTTPFIYNSPPMTYYAVLTNGVGCTYFPQVVTVTSMNVMTVEGISELYLTKYSQDVVINYWGAEDETFYIGGYDTNFYTSTKVKEFLNTTNWYEIPLVSADARYNQQLERGSNGITYNERIDVVVHHKDLQKWQDMVDLLDDRYIIVFRDFNNNYWTFGYESGTEIRQYLVEENAYKFSFIQPSVTKLLAAMSEDYVKNYII